MGFPDTPTQVSPAFATPPTASRPRRTGLFIGAAVAVLVLMASTGGAVWLLTRPHKAGAPAVAGSFVIDGIVRLNQGEFIWQSKQDQRCWGSGGYSDIAGGAQVTVTDAAGKKLAVGDLDTGGAEGITVDDRATSCVLKFKVPGIPKGAGPYGVEINHRGVLNYTEAELTSTVLTLGFS